MIFIIKNSKVRFMSLVGNGRHEIFVKKSKLEYAYLLVYEDNGSLI